MTDPLAKMIYRLLGLIGAIPRPVAHNLGILLGRIIYAVDARHRGIVRANLHHAMGGRLSDGMKRRLARRVFENLGLLIFELGESVRDGGRGVARRTRFNGIARYRAAQARNKGVLALTAHMGNWELLTVAAASAGVSLSVGYRPLDFAPLEQAMKYLRERHGATLIPTMGAMFRLIRVLRRGGTVALLMDQNVDYYNGVFVPFFGRRACTNKGMALLSIRSGAPVVPVFLVRDGRGGFIVEFGQELMPVISGDPQKDIEENTTRYNAAIEAMVNQYPDQWFWVHQRWKTRAFCPWPRPEGYPDA